MAAKQSALRTIYHIDDGAQSLYEIDARHALKFSKEWSKTPWKKNGEKAEPIVEIPEDYADLKASERIAIAVQLGADRKGLTGAAADAVIAAELDNRAAATE